VFRPLPLAASWRHEGARDGFETVFAEIEASGARLRGSTAAVEDGEPWFVRYEISVDGDWCTRRADVWTRSTRGAAHVRVEGDGDGNWAVDGIARGDLAGCLDVDLESSACTNTFPVHRLQLSVGLRHETPAVWVRAIDASVERLDQSYRRLDDAAGHQVYAYESPAFGFSAMVTFDERGLAVDYPGIAVRVF
jgi:hypothetical protein